MLWSFQFKHKSSPDPVAKPSAQSDFGDPVQTEPALLRPDSISMGEWRDWASMRPRPRTAWGRLAAAQRSLAEAGLNASSGSRSAGQRRNPLRTLTIGRFRDRATHTFGQERAFGCARYRGRSEAESRHWSKMHGVKRHAPS